MRIVSNFPMKIGELSKATGLPVETIRFYEAQGLIDPPLRMENNYRAYGERHLRRLQFVAHCRQLDMGLGEIRQILNYDSSDPVQAGRIHEVLHQQIEAVDRRISGLLELKERLLELEGRCHGHRRGERCGIIEELSSPVRPAAGGSPREAP